MATGPYGQGQLETVTPLEGGPEYDAFIQKVQHFYAQRGQVLPFTKQPGSKSILTLLVQNSIRSSTKDWQ